MKSPRISIEFAADQHFVNICQPGHKIPNENGEISSVDGRNYRVSKIK